MRADPRSASAADGQQQQTIDPWNPPAVAIGQDALDGYHAVSHQSWLGPEDMLLWEQPSSKEPKTRAEGRSRS